MKLITGDLLNITQGSIFHQVNCYKVMGAGLAKSLSDKWPQVKTAYLEFCGAKKPLDLLGSCQSVEITPELSVLNIFGQLTFGGNERHTDYGALLTAFKTASLIAHEKVYFPYLFGCGLANGQWCIVRDIIEKFFPDATIIQLPQ